MNNPFIFSIDIRKFSSELIDEQRLTRDLSIDPNNIPPEVAAKFKGTEYETWIKPSGALTSYGRKMIMDWVSRYNELRILAHYNTEGRKFLKTTLQKYRTQINNIHKETELDFTCIKSLPEIKILLYKSPSYNRRQSSEYYLGLLDNECVYIRKANHWGVFYTNITDLTEAVEELGLTQDDAYKKYLRDPFGRIGMKHHDWRLKNGKVLKQNNNQYTNTSQIGYIRLSDIV